MLIKSGDKVPITGYYRYFGHKNLDEYDHCVIVPSMNNMLFKKGSTAITTGSCKHTIIWRFIRKF